MAYRKTYRRNYRRRNYRSRVPPKTKSIRKLYGQKSETSIERYARYAGAIGSIARTVSGIAGLVNAETKWVDRSLAGSINNIPNYAVSLNPLAQGDTENNRNGNSVLCKSLSMRMHISLPVSNAAQQTAGIALILVKDPDTGATWPDVFATGDYFSPINMNNSEDFIVLKRWTVSFTPGLYVQKDIKAYINLKGIHTKYDGTGSTNFEKGEIRLIATTDQTDPLDINGISRFNFYDN